MATCFLKLHSPSMFSFKTYIIPLYKSNNKPLSLTTIRAKKPYYSYDLSITKPYQIVHSSGSIAREEVEYQTLCNGLLAESMPKHVALIMDGQSNLPHELGHGVGYPSLMDIARICCKLGVKVLSIYRPNKEDNFAINITKWDLEELARVDIKVSIIGKRDTIPESILEIITQVEETTKNSKALHIIEAYNYTGRFDIVQACIALAKKVEDGLIQPEEIDENVFQQELETKFSEFPNPDLLIRTGGKCSVDNFMLWQLAYSELYFVNKDPLRFNKTDFIEALDVYQKRNRRFGGSKKVI